MSNEVAAVAAEVVSPEVLSETPVESEIEASDASEEVAPSEEQAELKTALETKIKSLKLKIDGLEVDEQLPFEVTPEQAEWLKKELQLARVANKRMQESAELRKKTMKTEEDVQNFLNYLKSNPMEALEQLGLNTKEISEKRLQAEIEKMQMSDEERKIQELQEKVRKYEEEQEKIKEQARLEKEEALRNQYASEYEKDLMSAIEGHGFSYNPELIQRLSHYMATAIKLGVDLSFKDLMPLVQESINGDIAKLIPSLSLEQIEQMLGEDKIKGIVSKRKVVKKQVPPTAKNIEDTSTPKEKADIFSKQFKSGTSTKDFFSKI
jgi:hypothetical protein